jgi:hypothetical protein
MAGILLFSPLVALATISHRFAYDLDDLNKPILLSVALMMTSGILYLLISKRPRFSVYPEKKIWVPWIVLLGLLARLAMFTSTPVLEDDQYRYLWDGGVLANGFNPYQYSPQAVLDKNAQHIPASLRRLAEDADPIPRRINYPWLRTIYPPVSQCAFAIAHMIAPWSLSAWRLVLLFMDMLSLYMVYAILNGMRLPLTGLVIYWWNPLLIKEIYNSGHMDVLILPFVLAALHFLIQKRHLFASGALGLAVGVKFWPVVLLPVVLRPLIRESRRLFLAILTFAGVSLAVLLPFLVSGLGADSGFMAYQKTWEMNDAFFMLILWLAKLAQKALNMYAFPAQLLARVMVGAILLLWIFWILRKEDDDPLQASRRFLLVAAALFLISPTQFPWYYLWFLPFLAIQACTSLLLLTPLLSLYYLRPYFSARGMVNIHDNGIVWLEFGPVWILLAWEYVKRRRGFLGFLFD